MAPKTRTRRPTVAERHAARALGQPEPEEIVIEVTPTAAQHAARLTAPEKSEKPSGLATWDWYASRYVEDDEPPEDAA